MLCAEISQTEVNIYVIFQENMFSQSRRKQVQYKNKLFVRIADVHCIL